MISFFSSSSTLYNVSILFPDFPCRNRSIRISNTYLYVLIIIIINIICGIMTIWENDNKRDINV